MRLQQGFVLISVLVITTIGSVLALSTISENMLQERIVGNQQKQMNALSLAENGILKTQQFIGEQNSNTVDLNQLLTTINKLSGDGYSISLAELNGNQLSFVSLGEFSGAKAYLQAQVSIVSGGGGFPGGAIGCDGVILQGSGKLDSYNSNDGPYNADSNANSNATLQTISSDADVTLTGNASVHGNINVNGDFSSTGSAIIKGDVTTAGSITMTGGTGDEGGRIEGNVHAGGNLTLDSSTPVGGNADVVGNVTYQPNTGQPIAGDLTVGGLVNNDNKANDGHSNLANLVSYTPPGKPIFSSGVCDTLKIKEEIASYTNLTAKSNGDMDTSNQSVGPIFEFTPTSAEMFDSSSGKKVEKPHTEQTILGQANTPVHVFNDFSLKNGKINVSGGDVTVIVNGKFTTGGNPSSITVEAGSSLTILTEQTINIAVGTQLIAEGSVTDTGIAPIQIYSSYGGKDEGIILGGGTDMYVSVYAPLANVKVTGNLLGELRAKTVTVSGAGGIHFDEALRPSDPVPPTYATTFAAMYYYYP